MRPPLVIGLGNPLAGDDGVGCHVARAIRDHPDRPAGVEVLQTNDLLRLQDRLMDRPLIVIVDALLDDGPPARVLPICDLDELEARAGSVHHMSPARALMLLRAVYPELRDTRLVVAAVTVRRVGVETRLSPELQRHFDRVVDDVLLLLGHALSTAPGP